MPWTSRLWLSGVLMRLSGRAERLSFWLTDLSDRVRPRVKPSGPPITFAGYNEAVRAVADQQADDLMAQENDIFRELPLKEV